MQLPYTKGIFQRGTGAADIMQNLLLDPVNQEMRGQLVDGLLSSSYLQAAYWFPLNETLR